LGNFLANFLFFNPAKFGIDMVKELFQDLFIGLASIIIQAFPSSKSPVISKSGNASVLTHKLLFAIG
jgi:hypothetical protein